MKTELRLIPILLVLAPVAGLAESFLSHPEQLQPDERFAGNLMYFSEDALERLPGYDSVMVDEPVIFLAPDSPYDGFKASDMTDLSNLMRDSLTAGLANEPTSFGNYRVVDEPGTGVLYLRIALTNVYIRKNKRGLLSYTPTGFIAHGARSLSKEVFEKTTLVEMSLEAELLDSQGGEVLFAGILDLGHRKDKKAHVKEEAADWEVTGAIAETMGRRLACRLDNARRPQDQRRNCIEELPLEL